MTHSTKPKGQLAQLFQSQASRLLDLEVGNALRFSSDDYWAINSARMRAEKKQPGSKFSLRRRGHIVYVVRMA